MRTVSLDAVIESEIRVLKIERHHLRDTVTLEVDGEVMVLTTGSRIVSTLHGNYNRRDEESTCRSL